MALAACRCLGASLVIAKLDRLGRRLSFIAGLMDNDVPFFAADMPHADRFRLHLEAVIAEDERRRISEAQRAALQAAKARARCWAAIVATPCPRGRCSRASQGHQAKTVKATQAALAVLLAIRKLETEGRHVSISYRQGPQRSGHRHTARRAMAGGAGSAGAGEGGGVEGPQSRPRRHWRAPLLAHLSEDMSAAELQRADLLQKDQMNDVNRGSRAALALIEATIHALR